MTYVHTLNFICSISWAIASAGGRGFFSKVSDFLREPLSKPERAARLESRACSTYKNINSNIYQKNYKTEQSLVQVRFFNTQIQKMDPT